jgi:hypothetical protein
MKRAQKVVAATVICGALALGTAGVASAATPTGAGSAPATATHVTCARAPKALTRMAKVEHAISRRLPKLQAAETKAKAAGHTKVASRIERRIHRLQKVNTKARSLAKKINARCPQGTSGTGSGSAS